MCYARTITEVNFSGKDLPEDATVHCGWGGICEREREALPPGSEVNFILDLNRFGGGVVCRKCSGCFAGAEEGMSLTLEGLNDVFATIGKINDRVVIMISGPDKDADTERKLLVRRLMNGEKVDHDGIEISNSTCNEMAMLITLGGNKALAAATVTAQAGGRYAALVS